MTNLDKETSEIAREKRKQRAKERLSSLSGGDITRGLTSGVKERGLVSDTYSTQEAKAKVGAKSQAQKSKSGTLTTTKKTTTAKKSTTSSKSSTTTKTATKAKAEASKKTKATAVNVDVFEDDILLEEKTSKKSKKALGSIVVDESALENISTVTTDRRSKRNKVIISFLVVAIALIWISVLIMLFVKPKEETPNCFIQLSGTGSGNCEVLMNNRNISSWLAPTGIAQGSIYTFDLDLKIKQSGSYYVRFKVEVTNDGVPIANAVEISPNAEKVVEDGDGGVWYVYESVQGNSTLELLNNMTFALDWTNKDLVELNDTNALITFYVEVYSL